MESVFSKLYVLLGVKTKKKKTTTESNPMEMSQRGPVSIYQVQ